MDRAFAQRDRQRFSRARHGVSRRDGGARQISQALSSVRRAGAAHRLRRQRNQLLREMPNRRQAPGGSFPVAFAQRRLATEFGRAGGVAYAKNELIRRCASAPYAKKAPLYADCRVRLRTISFSEVMVGRYFTLGPI